MNAPPHTTAIPPRRNVGLRRRSFETGQGLTNVTVATTAKKRTLLRSVFCVNMFTFTFMFTGII